ncbi:Dipeptidyl carboxypeptidase Dcp, partial [hydrothermal vent metagenome]
MRHFFLSGIAISAVFLAAACTEQQPVSGASETAAEAITQEVEKAPMTTNTLLAKWTGPYGGTPAFDTVKLADLKPALKIGMAKNLAEIDAITSVTDAPSFENTIVA